MAAYLKPKPKQGRPLGFYKKMRVFLNIQGQYEALHCLAELEREERAVTAIFNTCLDSPASLEIGQGHVTSSGQVTE